jgi:hypothetical protein
VTQARLVVSRPAWRAIREALRDPAIAAPFGVRAAYAWSSTLFSITNHFQSRVLALETPATASRADPVFLLGFWRSGMTLLHELLSAESSLRSPTTAECMNPLNILRPARARAAAVMSRPMDSMRISADSPQEDEFALLALGADSIYRAFVAPRLLTAGEQGLRLHLRAAPEIEAWTAIFRDLLARLGRTDPRRLLLKSPSHSFRVRVLAPLLTGAQFLLVTRESRDIWCSNIRMWRAMTRRYALAPLDEALLRDFLRGAMAAFTEEVAWMRATLPAHRYQEVHYEMLARDPLPELARVDRALGIAAAGLGAGSIQSRWRELADAPRAPCPHVDCGWKSAAEVIARLRELTGYEPARE